MSSAEELLDGNVDEVRKAIRNADNPDYSTLLEKEKEGKDRKTIKKFLEPKIEEDDELKGEKDTEEPGEDTGDEESGEESDETDDNEEQEEPEDDEDTDEDEPDKDRDEEEDETPEDDSDSGDESSSGSSGGMEKKLQQLLEELDEVQGIKGAAVVRRDGLLIASNFDSEIEDDQVGAMTASTVGSGETASDALNMGDVDEVTIESENGKLVSTGAGKNGILSILTDANVNMGLVKVEMGKAVPKVKRIL